MEKSTCPSAKTPESDESDIGIPQKMNLKICVVALCICVATVATYSLLHKTYEKNGMREASVRSITYMKNQDAGARSGNGKAKERLSSKISLLHELRNLTDHLVLKPETFSNLNSNPKDNYYCYHWTAEDLAAIDHRGWVEKEREQCESYQGYVFTQGRNADYPDCGTCWCCKPEAKDNYYCYHWTAEDLAAIDHRSWVEKEREQCESYQGYVFTQGRNADYPDCGTCWCCKPEADNYYCYHWTAEDLAAIDHGGWVEKEREQCESYQGYVFTQGRNADYPDCGTCWCCKPEAKDNYYCYHWTAEDLAAIDHRGWVEKEREQCESYQGYVFTQGRNADYPDCGTCWCCKPEVILNRHQKRETIQYFHERDISLKRTNFISTNVEACPLQRTRADNYYCYHWTAEDLTTIDHGGWIEKEREQCESYQGYVFTQGRNADYPDCGTCWCCKPEAKDNYYCYHWTAEDLAAIDHGGWVEKEREQCESYQGYVFTQGRNADYPNCGTCWCCKPEVKDNYYCYHWTAEDLAAIGHGGGGVQAERQQCENYQGFVFTQGRNAGYPNCGTCWCCKPEEYECYRWTTEDLEVMGAGKGTAEAERARCEDDLGFIFTHGKNENYPGTEDCWCIQPKS